MLRNSLKPIAAAAALAAGLVAGSGLHAQETPPQGTPGGMMGQGGMTGMMPQMEQMMGACARMMQSATPAQPPEGGTAPRQGG